MNLEDLVTKGYFPEELPYSFDTSGLAKILPEVIANPEVYSLMNGQLQKISKVIPFSTPKIRAYRRTLHIPNPLHYIKFSEHIVNNWAQIIQFTSRSKISLSPLVTEAHSKRALAQPSFDIITQERILRSTGFSYILKVDIQKFYGNIYTHSIPWALHTKPVAKRNRRPDGNLGNKLDWFIRGMQDSQTMGIPIGPDTSRIISEIIVSHIDVTLEAELGDLHGIRVVDDYSLYFKDLADLEKARSLIFKLLRDVELDLNQAKEKVLPLPEIIESEWYNRLRSFKFRNKRGLQTKDIIAYFDISFLYSAQYPEEAVLPYSISKICASVFRMENWPILESLLLKSLQVEPKVLPYVINLFISHRDEGYNLSTRLIRKTLDDFLHNQLQLDNHFEITWTLWFMKHLELSVSERTAVELSKSDNSIVILTALDLRNSNLIPEGLDLTEWQKLATRDNLYSEHWLVAYETVVQGWLVDKLELIDGSYIDEDPFFRLLKDNDVRFYTPDKDIDVSHIKVASEKVSLSKYKSDEQDSDDDDDDEVTPVRRPARKTRPNPIKPNPSIEADDLPF